MELQAYRDYAASSPNREANVEANLFKIVSQECETVYSRSLEIQERYCSVDIENVFEDDSITESLLSLPCSDCEK